MKWSTAVPIRFVAVLTLLAIAVGMFLWLECRPKMQGDDPPKNPERMFTFHGAPFHPGCDSEFCTENSDSSLPRVLAVGVNGIGSIGVTLNKDILLSVEPIDALVGTLDIGHGVTLPFSFSMTNKGNGGLHIGHIFVRIYDAHDDGLVFKDWLLDHRFVDLNGDGYFDLVVWGTAIYTDEKDAKELRRRPVRSIFEYDPMKGLYVNSTPDDAIMVLTGQDM